jgi:hypothetical protein
VRVLALAAGAALAVFAPAAAQEPGVVAATIRLPSAGAAYHGGTHVFLDGRARLTCSSHGGFTSGVEPPAAPGTTAIADYFATFAGELALDPPLARSAVVHPIEGRARMVERLTFAERREGVTVLDAEIVAFDLRGGGMPEGVLVRESPGTVSSGRTTVTTVSRGRYRVESSFDVWLELSLDGGRSWSRAAAPVRMTLAPADADRRATPAD